MNYNYNYEMYSINYIRYYLNHFITILRIIKLR